MTKRPPLQRGVIYGVSTLIEDDEIKAATGAKWVRRINSQVKGEQHPTNTVVVTFEGQRPDEVKLGGRQHAVRPYIAQPLRCKKCQNYGHPANRCQNRQRCPRCGGDHFASYCPSHDDVGQLKCVHCAGAHRASSRSCPKFTEVAETLRVSATHGLSYRDSRS